MKRLLITGINSYVGTSVEKWLLKYNEEFDITTLDMKNSDWRNHDFSQYDVVFHVAGIAHNSHRKKQKELYFRVNRDLTIETAVMAKKASVNHFIFMSSIIVYSSKETEITLKTNPDPDNFYGKSKLEAEKGLIELESKKFVISIIRAPMIYGPNSKGNFPRLMNFSKKTRIFPKFKNKRSILYIDNLNEFVKQLIELECSGIFFPQNSSPISTTEIVESISKVLMKKIVFTRLFNPIIILLRNKINFLNKIFGNRFYSIELSKYDFEYNIVDIVSSIKDIEGGHEINEENPDIS